MTDRKVHELKADDFTLEFPFGEKRKRGPRKAKLSTLIAQAEKAGKSVSSVTTDGVTLTFGSPEPTKANDLDAWMKKHAH